MSVSSLLRQHWAALRALLVFTLILGGAYPLLVWLVAQVPWLSDEADGSIGYVGGKAVGSSLVGQSFTDAQGNALPRYLQGRPSAAGAGYDPMASGASNLGPESIVDVPVGGGGPSQTKPSLLTQVCSRSLTIGRREGVSGARPYCTGDGVGAVLSVIGPRDDRGEVAQPVRVISVNEPCSTSKEPFLESYRGVRVECAAGAEDQSAGQLVPIRGAAPEKPAVPADAVTASGSGLDPDISPAYAQLQVDRIAAARGISPDRVRDVITSNTHGRVLGFLGESTVNVLAVNRALDRLGG